MPPASAVHEPAFGTTQTPLEKTGDTGQIVTGPHYLIIMAISLCHLINDIMQSLLAAIYPLLQAEFALSYAQIGLLTLAFMGTASVLQPLIGMATDRRAVPQSLALGMGATLCGLLLLALGPQYLHLLAGAALIGVGSAVFHPEASRVARAAAGGRFGTAQSLFQVGGNAGHALGPLLTAFIVVPLGRAAVGAFAALALVGMAILAAVGGGGRNPPPPPPARHPPAGSGPPPPG
ncbi:MAG: MFS transporter, partial [Pararhodobacter sp.]|nr:MFS transporter [Pararhodobacter sp.]